MKQRATGAVRPELGEAKVAGQRRVLCIVDDRQERERLAAALEAARCTVVIAASGAEAIALAQGHRPELIVLDLSVADLDPYEMVTDLSLMEETRDVPVVALVDDEAAEQDQLALALCQERLPKTMTNEALAETLRRCLHDIRGLESGSSLQVRRLRRQVAQLQAELAQVRREAEAGRRLRLQWAALVEIARELCRPLTIILCYTETLPRGLEHPEEAHLCGAVLVAEMQRLARTLRRLQTLLAESETPSPRPEAAARAPAVGVEARARPESD